MYASPIPYKEWEHSGLHRVTGTEQVPAEADTRGCEQAVHGVQVQRRNAERATDVLLR